MEITTIGGFLAACASVGAIVYPASEILGRLGRAPKDLVAVLAGPAAAIIFNAAGYLVHAPAPGWRGYLAAGAGGLLGTLTAGATHDYLVNPVLRAVASARGKEGPQA